MKLINTHLFKISTSAAKSKMQRKRSLFFIIKKQKKKKIGSKNENLH